MDDNAKVTLLISQSVCAMIEAMGMVADNQQRLHRGEPLAWDKESFDRLPLTYGIHWNAAIGMMR